MTTENEAGGADGADQREGAPDSGAGATAAAVHDALSRILASQEFVSSPRLADFLRFVVEATLAGRQEEIKGYTIAVEALGRPTSFDPQTDPIVRVEATRLRRALERYYASVGPDETLEIAIPKGGYVPQFIARGGATASAEPEAEAERGPDVPPAGRAQPRSRSRLAGMALLAAALGLGILAPVFGPQLAERLGFEREGRNLADRVGLPIVEVRAFETAAGAPRPAELRALETRLRDSFARFDFVQVMDDGESASVRECHGTPPRSVFSLSALAEPGEGGTFSLLARLTDKCDGTIVWANAYEGLRGGGEMAVSEQKVVREMSAALMESYAAIPTRARAQARLNAPQSAYGCIAHSFAVLRGDETASAEDMRSCLSQVAARDPAFALAHAMKAAVLLDEARKATDRAPDPAQLSRMIQAAELAVDLAPTSAYAARTLALVDAFQGERDAAFQAAEQALRLNPLDYDVAASMGTVFIGIGRVEQGEALLTFARANGASRTPLQDAYLGTAAFLRDDATAAAALVPALQIHPSPQTRIALALALRTLGRLDDEREVVAALARRLPGGADGVRRVVTALLPDPALSAQVLAELERAGLSPHAALAVSPLQEHRPGMVGAGMLTR